LKCTGIDDPTKRIRKQDLTERHVKKDYKFLQGVILDTEIIMKRLNYVSHNQELLRLKLLKSYARKVLQADIKFAPSII